MRLELIKKNGLSSKAFIDDEKGNMSMNKRVLVAQEDA